MADGLIWTTDQWRAERLSSTPSDKYKYTKQDPTWQTKRSSLLDQTTVAPRRLPSAQLLARDAYLRPLPMDSTSHPPLTQGLPHDADASSSYPKRSSRCTPDVLLPAPRVQSTPTTTALTPPRQSALATMSAIRQSVLMAAIATTTTAPSAPIALQPQVSPVRVSLTRGNMQARAPRRAVHLQHLRQRRKRSSHSSPYP